MSERARNAIFNSLSEQLSGARILDCYAGSGSIGLEAISRGAHSAVFVEKNKIAARIITANAELLGCTNNTKVSKVTVSSWLDTFDGGHFDIVLADPPYDEVSTSVLSQLSTLVKPDGLLVLSLPKQSIVTELKNCERISYKIYSGATISIFRKH